MSPLAVSDFAAHTSRTLLLLFVCSNALFSTSGQSVTFAKQFPAVDSFQRGQNLLSQDQYYASLPSPPLSGPPADGMMVGGGVGGSGPRDGNARDYRGILHAMKRHMSMLRLRRANRELRSFGGGGGSPMNRMTMLRLRRYRQPSMLRLKRVTQMRLKKDQEDPPYVGEYDYSDDTGLPAA